MSQDSETTDLFSLNVYLLLVHHQWINYRWLPSKEDLILTGAFLSQKVLTGKNYYSLIVIAIEGHPSMIS